MKNRKSASGGKKFIYIPGFLDTGKSRKMKPSLDIWTEDYEPWGKLDYKYVIGHSLGANFALLNWVFNRNAKLILTNPLLKREKFPQWANRWLRYAMTGREKFNEERKKSLKNLPLIEKRLRQIFMFDYWEILSRIPKKDVIIIRGMEDKYLCDEETAILIKKKKYRFIEVPQATHDWNDVAAEAKKMII